MGRTPHPLRTTARTPTLTGPTALAFDADSIDGQCWASGRAVDVRSRQEPESWAHTTRGMRGRDPEFRRLALAVIIPIAVVTLGTMIWLWPSDVVPAEGAVAAEQVSGVISGIDQEPCPEELADEVNGCGRRPCGSPRAPTRVRT